MLSGRPTTSPTACRSRTARPSRSRSLAAPAPLEGRQWRREPALLVGAGEPDPPLRDVERQQRARAGSRAAKAAALSHTVKACSFRAASRPAGGAAASQPTDCRACRSTRPPWPASPCSPGSRCRRPSRSGWPASCRRSCGWIEQLGEVDTAGVEPMRSVMPLPHALARRRGDRRRAARRDPGQRARGRTTATSSCRRWSNERAHRPDPDGGARRSARAQASPPASWPGRISRRSSAIAASTPSSPRRRSRRSPWPAAADARLAQGEGGLLEGIPLAIKDLFCTEGVLTTAGSHILDGFVPPYELTVTANSGKRVPSASARPISTSSRWARRT